MRTLDDAPIGAARKLAGFHGLRAIAVLSVAAFHFVLLVPLLPDLRTFGIAFQLRVGVWIFFVISGFLLYRPFAHAHAGMSPEPSVPRYAVSRVLRIWPAYAVAVVVLSLIWHQHQFVYGGAKSFLVHLSLTQNFFRSEITHGLGPAWSLVVELSFYAFLPVYAWVIGRFARGREVWLVEVVGGVVLIAFGMVWQLASAGDIRWATMLPGFLPTFAIGIMLAVAVVHRRDFGVSVIARRPWWCWSAALVLLLAKGAIGGSDGFQPGFRLVNQLVYSSVAFLVVVPAVFGDGASLGNRVLRSWPFRQLGLVSYGVFLWSVPVIATVQWEWLPQGPGFPLRAVAVALVSLVVTLAVATASWFIVERPALRLKRFVPRSKSGV